MTVLGRYLPGDSPAGLSYTRSGPGTYTDANGLVVSVLANVLRDSHFVSGVRYTLLEPGATNLQRISANFQAAANDWANSTATITPASAVAPDGTLTANRIEMATAGAGSCWCTPNGGAMAAGSYVGSWWTRNIGGGQPKYSVYNETAAAEIVTPTAYTITNNWTRYSTPPFTVPAGNPKIRVYPNRDAVATVDMMGWGMQVELGTFATSYIPTTTIAVARGDDLLHFTFAPPPQQMTALLDFIDLGAYSKSSGAYTPNLLTISDSGSDVAYFGLYADGTVLAALQESSGGGAVQSTVAGLPTLGDRVEQRGVLASDGAVTMGRSFNQASESVGSQSAPQTLLGTWSAQQLYLAGLPGFAIGALALRGLVIVTGSQTLDTMRANMGGHDGLFARLAQ